jgi:predicted RNase H-like HicB family nuclease
MIAARRRIVKFAVVLTPGEDGFIVAECPTLPGCVTQGKAEDEALRNAKEAIAGWLEVEAEKVSKEAEAPVVLVDV